MIHRHINKGFEDSVAAVEDVLDNGTEDDWRELARHIMEDPTGSYAKSLRVVLSHVRIYGVTRLWQDFLRVVETGVLPRPPYTN